MTYTEAYERLSEIEAHYQSGFSASERTLLTQLYGNILNKAIRNLSCGDCYRDAYIELCAFLRKNKGKESIRNYRLREGETLHFFGDAEYFSNPIDDNIAESFLRKYPSLIAKFDYYPTDWKSRVSQTDVAEPRRRGRKKSN